jgi:hypothetical protein
MGGGGGKGGGGGGGATSTINVTNSGTTNVDSDSTVEIKGLDNLKETIDLKLPQPFKTETTTELKLPQPFKTESRQELAITQPIVTDSNSKSAMALDIRPMTVDLCLKLSLGPIPPTCIRQPYHTHFGFTLYGQELFGFSFSGESQVIVQDLPKQPQVDWGGDEMAERPHPTVVASQAYTGQKESRSGLRIRVGT